MDIQIAKLNLKDAWLKHGCCDGLQFNGINRNQGAESTLAYLIAHLTVLKAMESVRYIADCTRRTEEENEVNLKLGQKRNYCLKQSSTKTIKSVRELRENR